VKNPLKWTIDLFIWGISKAPWYRSIYTFSTILWIFYWSNFLFEQWYLVITSTYNYLRAIYGTSILVGIILIPIIPLWFFYRREEIRKKAAMAEKMARLREKAQ